MNYLHSLYERLSDEQKDEFFKIIYQAVRKRGGYGILLHNARNADMDNVAKLFQDSLGVEFEEYT